MQRLVLILAVFGAASCGSPTAPSPPAPPPVANATPAPPAPSPTPAPSPAPSPTPTPAPPPTSTVLRMAAIGGANGHSASGTARILGDGSGGFVLELGADFRIDSGNNDVMLTRSATMRTGSDLNLGNMRSLTGRQMYALPNDGSAYSYVLLWCRPFNVPIGVGELR